jgi:hypothetical protein
MSINLTSGATLFTRRALHYWNAVHTTCVDSNSSPRSLDRSLIEQDECHSFG